jgi:hypothetical protein
MTVAVTTLMPLGLPLASDPCHRGFVLVWLQQLLQLVPLRQPLVRCLIKKSTVMISTGFRLTRKEVKTHPQGYPRYQEHLAAVQPVQALLGVFFFYVEVE